MTEIEKPPMPKAAYLARVFVPMITFRKYQRGFYEKNWLVYSKAN